MRAATAIEYCNNLGLLYYKISIAINYIVASTRIDDEEKNRGKVQQNYFWQDYFLVLVEPFFKPVNTKISRIPT